MEQSTGTFKKKDFKPNQKGGFQVIIKAEMSQSWWSDRKGLDPISVLILDLTKKLWFNVNSGQWWLFLGTWSTLYFLFPVHLWNIWSFRSALLWIVCFVCVWSQVYCKGSWFHRSWLAIANGFIENILAKTGWVGAWLFQRPVSQSSWQAGMKNDWQKCSLTGP